MPDKNVSQRYEGHQVYSTITNEHQELGDLSKNAPVGMTVGLKEESNMNIWKVDMEGPAGTPYAVRLLKKTVLDHQPDITN